MRLVLDERLKSRDTERGKQPAPFMISQKHCPFCQIPSVQACSHLALAAEARDFVRRCVERSQGQAQWQLLCNQRHLLRGSGTDWSPNHEDFTWLETAFCDMFLKHLSWFGGMDYEWRSGPKPEEGGFWVLLWSREPQQQRDRPIRRSTL